MSNLANRKPDFDQFLKVLKREGKPNHLPFYEHLASPGFMSERVGVDFYKLEYGTDDYWKNYVDFYIGMGYDCVPMEVTLNCPHPQHPDALSESSEAMVVIRNREDYDKYPWPDESNPLDFSQFEIAAKFLPEGAKIVGGVEKGPYEWISEMLGTIGLSYLLMDDPELVNEVALRLRGLHTSSVRQLATMDFIGAIRQGDDLGFKTSTFLSPAYLRKFIFPTYKIMVEHTHNAGKPFILHSCGNLGEVYNDLIDDCKIDAKHSFEDIILSVGDFKKIYGKRITPLGGMDVDVLCRSSKEDIKKYVRKTIDDCFYDGYWALGTGNSLTNYMPVENYITALEEAVRYTA